MVDQPQRLLVVTRGWVVAMRLGCGKGIDRKLDQRLWIGEQAAGPDYVDPDVKRCKKL